MLEDQLNHFDARDRNSDRRSGGRIGSCLVVRFLLVLLWVTDKKRELGFGNKKKKKKKLKVEIKIRV